MIDLEEKTLEMNSLGKKVGYLKGIMEGMTFSDPAQEKLLRTMAELLGDLSDRVEGIDDLLDDLNDYVESIDDDLAELEGDRDDGFSILDEDELDDEEFLDELDNDADHLHLIGGSGDAPASAEDTLAGAICPDCEHLFFVGVDDPEGSRYTCPHCGHSVTPAPLTPENAPIARPVDPE